MGLANCSIGGLERSVTAQRNLVRVNEQIGDLRVVTYSILADSYISPGDFPQCPDAQRYMGQRHTLIKKEIALLDPDIVCLQEVEPVVFDQFFQQHMAREGYDGRYMKKSSMSPEGCATFWRVREGRGPGQTFRLIEQHAIELNVAATEACRKSGMDPTQSRVLYDNVCLALLLRPLVGRRAVLVGNTQVLSHAKQPDSQTLQTALILSSLNKAAQGEIKPVDCSSRTTADNDPAVLLCGNFNQLPDGPGISLIRNGFLDEKQLMVLREHPPPLLLDPQRTGASKVAGQLVDLLRPYYVNPIGGMQSACKVVLGNELRFTRFPSLHKKGCVDFIFATHHLTPVACLDLPNEDLVKPGIPSGSFPSDHILVYAEFCSTNQALHSVV